MLAGEVPAAKANQSPQASEPPLRFEKLAAGGADLRVVGGGVVSLFSLAGPMRCHGELQPASFPRGSRPA
jgi:hypothetical protein